ncbi:uncharacterized protein PAE49_008565 [Odontesthes bonariensis]|uniref:uncharacterized protein LOC142384849 n=1 Tax=Odontesthes bonariensis TaxID=219752 RepID=UPI003F586FBB
MLIKTKIDTEQKYVKISEPSLEEFLNAAFTKFSIPPVVEGIKVFDDTGTEVDEEIFEELVHQPSTGILTITFGNASQERTLSSCSQGSTSSHWTLETSFSPTSVHQTATDSAPELPRCDSDDTIILELAACSSVNPIHNENDRPPSKRQKIKWMDTTSKELVESALIKKPGGDQILKEYMRTKSLTDGSRRKLVNILAADMSEIHGTAPPRHVREMYAQGIIEMFPNLRDPYSKNGYEHFYDGESGSGYLAWRLKTIQRKSTLSEGRRSSCQLTGGGPTARRDASFNPEVTLSEEQCKEAISFMKYSSDEAAIKNKMKMTFDDRRKMVLDENRSSDVLTEFPRFRDVKGLVADCFQAESYPAEQESPYLN